MRLTALCICGTLLALLNLSWATSDYGEGDLLVDKGFGPCIATLRPERPCREGQDENTCPYIFTLPPLTVHLPKQLRELEKIVKDLQKLKDNVDQLKKICEDCTVRQSKRRCESQREREYEKLNEGTARLGDEKNWMNESHADILKESGMNRSIVEKIEGDGDTDYENRTIVEEKDRKKWQTEREEKGVVKENKKEDPLKKVGAKDGNTQTKWLKGKDKLEQTKLPNTAGKDRIEDAARERVVENRNRQTGTDIKKENDGKGFSKGEQEDNVDSGKERKMTINKNSKEEIQESDPYVRRYEMKEAENKTQHQIGEKDKGGGIKMYQVHDEHTNKEQEQHREEKNKKKEKIKQTENIGSAIKEIIKAWEVEKAGDKEIGMEINTKKNVSIVHRESDDELAFSKATEKTDFVPISTTPRSAVSLAAKDDAMDLNQATSFTPSLPSPPLSSFTLNLMTDVNQRTTTAIKIPTPNTGAAGISEHPSKSTKSRTLSGSGKQITSTTTKLISKTSTRPEANVQAQVVSTTTITTPSHNLYSTSFPGGANHGHGSAKKNIGSNTNIGLKTPLEREQKPGEKHKPEIKPEADQKPNNPKNDHEPGRTPLPDKTTKSDQKRKSYQLKPLTGLESKPGKETKPVQASKPDQRPCPDNVTTDQNLKNNKKPNKTKLNKNHPVHVTDQKSKVNVKPKPVQNPQITQGLKTPLSDQVDNFNPKSVPHEIPRAESSKTAKPKAPAKQRPPTRTVLKPGATPGQRPKPAVQPQPSSKTKTDLDLHLISVTTSIRIQDPQSDMPPTSAAVKQIADVTRSPTDTEFSPSTMKTITLGPKTYNTLETGYFPRNHPLPKGFTKHLNNGIRFDVNPQAAGKPSPIPVTPRPNNIRGISPEPTKPNLGSKTDSQVTIHNMEKTAPRQIPDPDKIMIPVPSPSTQTTFTMSPKFRSPTPVQSEPPEPSTPSARELRVKINQVAALLNNSLIVNRRPLDGHTKEHPKENQGGSRPENTDSKLPTLTSSKGKR
ncbi:Fibroleukin Fibrinogen-like protein 2 Precursor [Channa argus]|uniref:Fibroleukin Fibrinogen-like protein 2 n=1 Tax=Channa argus TaxID=215402 RepID=A0A6G1PF49_CHAAH|nr:Fibroleukin Fibrinogen-like protein 2 Precursor [Channa argus]